MSLYSLGTTLERLSECGKTRLVCTLIARKRQSRVFLRESSSGLNTLTLLKNMYANMDV